MVIGTDNIPFIIFNIRHKTFRCPSPPLSMTLTVLLPPPLDSEAGGLKRSGQRLISLNA